MDDIRTSTKLLFGGVHLLLIIGLLFLIWSLKDGHMEVSTFVVGWCFIAIAILTVLVMIITSGPERR